MDEWQMVSILFAVVILFLVGLFKVSLLKHENKMEQYNSEIKRIKSRLDINMESQGNTNTFYREVLTIHKEKLEVLERAVNSKYEQVTEPEAVNTVRPDGRQLIIT